MTTAANRRTFLTSANGFLTLLKSTGYHGRVGLQGYGVPGPSSEHLRRSMEKWRQMIKQLSAK